MLNSSGSLESVGDFSLRAASISNTREGLSVNDLGVYTARITELACDHRYVGDCEGSNRNGIFEVVQREKLTVSGGAAAQMTSGGNMRLLGGQLTNQSSAIAAGGALSISVDSLSNQGVVPGETQSTRVYVTARHTLGVHQDAANDFTRQYWFESSDYDPNNLSGLQPTLSHYLSTTESEISSLAKSETLSAGDQSYAAVIQAAGNADIRVGGNLDNTVVRPGYTYINPGRNTNTAVGASPVSTVVPINAQLPPSLAQQQINPITLPGFSLPTGSNGLFRLSGQSGSGGSASSVQGPQTLSFAGQSIGAAQRQQALDVGNRQTDGVSAPVASVAVSGPSSGALNVARVQGLHLSVGVGLSAEQVAALTHDIVWLEEAEVNGEKVLVPVLYLAQAKNRLAPNGALIQGQDVSLISGGKLTNQGTLRASGNLSASAANIDNSGLVEGIEKVKPEALELVNQFLNNPDLADTLQKDLFSYTESERKRLAVNDTAELAIAGLSLAQAAKAVLMGNGGALAKIASGLRQEAADGAKGTAGSVSSATASSATNASRLNMQLVAEQAAGARAPTQITGYSSHAVEQIAGRDGGIGVSQSALNNAWTNPLKIEYVPSKYGPTFKYTGGDAVIVVNTDGKVVTGWAKSSSGTGK